MSIIAKHSRSIASVLALAALALCAAGMAGTKKCYPVAAVFGYLSVSLLILRACAVKAHSLRAFVITLICMTASFFFVFELFTMGIDYLFYMQLAFFLAMETSALLIGIFRNRSCDSKSEASEGAAIPSYKMGPENRIYQYTEAMDFDLGLTPGTVAGFSLEDKARLISLHKMRRNDKITEFLARRNGSFHPYEGRLGQFLISTYGMLLWKHQIVDLCASEAGLSEDEVSIISDRAYKGKMSLLNDENKVLFLNGCKANGLSESEAMSTWEIILKDGPFCYIEEEALAIAREMTSKTQTNS